MKKLISIFLSILPNLSYSNIHHLDMGSPINANKVKENYLHIQQEMTGYPVILDFSLPSSGDVISSSLFNSNYSKLNLLNPDLTIPFISENTKIAAEDINLHFEKFISEINTNWKISNCEEIISSSRYKGPGIYWIDPDVSGPKNPIAVYCTNLRNTKQFYTLKGTTTKTLNNESTTDFLLNFAKSTTTTSGSLSFSGTHELIHNSTQITTELVEYPSGTYGSANYCDGVADSKMCMVRFAGNVTLNGTHTTAVRKKGLVIYIDGDLTLNGNISMTARGAIAAGQNLYLANNYSVPAIGGAGGYGVLNTAGTAGGNGTNGATGGGAGGGAVRFSTLTAKGGSGSAGTSYSGGSGGGGATARSYNTVGGDAAPNGGQGGSAHGAWDWKAGAGTGNPGGIKKTGNAYEYVGSSGTGGLLIIYVNGNLILNSGALITSDGTIGTSSAGYGGASGAGSVNVFYSGVKSGAGIIRANGVATPGTSQSGNGTARAIQLSLN